jgi:L-lactate dehydrogenase complex protein LldG
MRRFNPAENSSTRDEILGRLRNVVAKKTGNVLVHEKTDSFFLEESLPLGEKFKRNLEEVGGRCYLPVSKAELCDEISGLVTLNGWVNLFCPEDRIRRLLEESGFHADFQTSLDKNTDVVVSGCEFLVSSLGSVLVSSAQAGSRRMFVFPPVHIVIAGVAQLVESLDEAFFRVVEKYGDEIPSFISVITGPSRTADIEKTLILGAHGPGQLFVFVAEWDL